MIVARFETCHDTSLQLAMSRLSLRDTPRQTWTSAARTSMVMHFFVHDALFSNEKSRVFAWFRVRSPVSDIFVIFLTRMS
jgi:hypothetical protein